MALAVALGFVAITADAWAAPVDGLDALLARGRNPGIQRYTAKLRKALAAFYTARDHEAVWNDAKALRLIKTLKRAGEHGLVPADYGLAVLPRLSAQPARRELLLSVAATLFAGDLNAGRFAPGRINREIHLSPTRPDPASVLARLMATSDIGKALAGYAPNRPEYQRLRAGLVRYRAIVARGGWPRIVAPKGLSKGSRGAAVAALRARLAATGDLPAAAAAGTIYDDAVVAAVKHYQVRNNRFVTGIVTRVDLAALNRSAVARVMQLRVNLERRRWMQDGYGDPFILVNQADFMVKMVRKGKTIYTSKIIIGTRNLRTPVFRAALNEVGFNPVWNVPRSITRNELLPGLKKKPKAYLRRRSMTLHDPKTGKRLDPDKIDWSKVKRGSVPFRVRQSPGRRNALGRVKFMFPNPYNVYLHDTPTQHLFKRRLRCFSHGCMRLADPVGFAHALLGGQGWTRKKIKAAIDSGRRRSVFLPSPVPVHVTYLSAWIDKDGTVQFRDDVYGRDRRLELAFARLDRRVRGRKRRGVK